MLIVKRWRNLPQNTEKHWAHVVNSRSGPGNKVTNTRRGKAEEHPLTVHVEKFDKIRRKKRKGFVFKKPQVPSTQESSSDIPGFINLFYWKRQTTCCGVVYEGQAGEVMIDQRLFKKCQHHSLSQSAPESPVKLVESKSSDMEYEDIKSMDEDSDTISFYSDDTDSDRMSKLSREDFSAVIDTDGDEGFYDKSETRRLVQ